MFTFSVGRILEKKKQIQTESIRLLLYVIAHLVVLGIYCHN